MFQLNNPSISSNKFSSQYFHQIHHIDIEKIATGEHWYGKRALDLQLVDELITSDDYLYTAATDANIYEITQIRKKAISEKLFSLGMKLFGY